MDKHEILIEKYLHQELSETEVKELNQLLESDSDFREEFEMRTIMYADYKTEVKHSLRKIAGETTGESSPVQKSPSYVSAIWKLLLIISLLALAYLLFNKSSTKKHTSVNSSQLIAEYLENDMKYPTVTKDNIADPEDFWSIAKQQYITNKYEEFLKTIQDEELTDEQQYYKGLALALQEKPNYTEAISQLETIPIESLFKEEANWYMALFYIENDQQQEGIALLNSIVKTKSWHFTRASKLLQKIQK